MADRLGYRATAAGSQAYRHSTGSATEPLRRIYMLADSDRLRYRATPENSQTFPTVASLALRCLGAYRQNRYVLQSDMKTEAFKTDRPQRFTPM